MPSFRGADYEGNNIATKRGFQASVPKGVEEGGERQACAVLLGPAPWAHPELRPEPVEASPEQSRRLSPLVPAIPSFHTLCPQGALMGASGDLDAL